MTSTVHLAAAAAGPRAAAVEVLVAAFDADPIYRLLLPDERQRPRALGALFHVAVGDAARWGAVDLAARGAQVIGAALWLQPGRFPPGVARKLRSLPGLVSLWRAAPGAFLALARLGRSVEALHRSEPAWYLQALGVHPAAQGRGIGAGLLSHGLERADRDRVAARLETAVPAAARLYERFGFATIRRGMPLVVDGPTHALLRRPPITVRAADKGEAGASGDA
jgi:ribosomal protein S18 acetylase RimI-like enzyme